MAFILRISPNSIASGVHCVKVVEDVVVEKFTFAISSPGDEFLISLGIYLLDFMVRDWSLDAR